MPDVHSPAIRSYNMSRITLLMPIVLTLIFPVAGYTQQPQIAHYSLSECSYSSTLHLVREGVVALEYRFDTLYLEVSRILNCLPGDDAAVSFRNDTLILEVLYLRKPVLSETGDTIGWQELESYECNCCFTFSYKITGLHDTGFVVVHEGKVMNRIPYMVVPFYTITALNDTLWAHDAEGYVYKNRIFPSGRHVWVEKTKYGYQIRRTYNDQEQLVRESIWNRVYKDQPFLISRSFIYNLEGELINVEEKVTELEWR